MLSFELEGARLSDAFLAMTESVEVVGARRHVAEARAGRSSASRSFAISGSAGAARSAAQSRLQRPPQPASPTSSRRTRALNFLEQRESVNLTLQVAIAVGALLALLAAADTVSGERERGTLETLLLAPVPRLQLLLQARNGCEKQALERAALALAADRVGRGEQREQRADGDATCRVRLTDSRCSRKLSAVFVATR